MTLHIPTPLIESRPLSLAAGRNIWLKLDALQPCGSFKLRGVGHACEVHYARGARHLVSSSGAMPAWRWPTPGANWGAGDRGGARDHHRTGQGAAAPGKCQGTGTRQLVAGSQRTGTDPGRRWRCLHSPLRRPAAVGRACQPGRRSGCGRLQARCGRAVGGGGGLLSGVVEGLQRNGWADVPVLAVETTGAASLHAAMQAGHTVALPRIASIAGSLGAKRVAEQALACTRRQPVHSHLVSDRAALQACERFLQDHRLLVEPACGAALALAYDASAMARYPNVLVVVCGVLPPLWNRYRRGCDRSTDTGCHLSVSFAVYH